MQSLKNIFLQELRDLPITKPEAETTAQNLIERMCSAIVTDGGFECRGKFGRVTIATKKAHTGHNPKTGEPINIPARRVVKYRPGKEITDALKAK